ncbi:hypothetical protein ATEIFO6365_0002035600 [Aspergillus terreus]|uniref:DUF7600 domain-containing protein n=1 Tax=Aspergillus terreus TaxID=33178 RepID=A0A5M3YUL3_ASPTE|nr:hypothetical protein ATETN484_0004035600 [Aspergillus terreus]GFF13246.1 hypothetical protein ATEIFO6365_0002035600 [Aspergillus terreus]
MVKQMRFLFLFEHAHRRFALFCAASEDVHAANSGNCISTPDHKQCSELPRMYKYDVYCSFCGVVIQKCSDEEIGEIGPLPWHAEVRAIVGTPDLEQAFVTGVGMIEDLNNTTVYAPRDAHLSYTDDVELETFVVFCHAGVELHQDEIDVNGEDLNFADETIAFAVHDACWQLLVTRLRQSGHIADLDVVASIFRHLHCTPCPDFSDFYPEEYGGAEHTPGALEYVFDKDPFSPCYACPSTLPSLDELANMVQPTGMPTGLRPNTSCHTLSKLPPRWLVCRDWAFLAKFERLPQLYFKSQFAPEMEAAFVSPSLGPVKRDWSRTFRGARSSLKLGKTPLINRWRVWKLLDPVFNVVVLDCPSGTLLLPSHAHEHVKLTDDKSGNLPESIMVSASLNYEDQDGPLGYGCRSMEVRAAPLLVNSPGNGGRIRVSTIQHGADKFITGLSFSQDRHCAVSRYDVGFHNPSSLAGIEIPQDSYVESIKAAFGPCGLMGLKFVFSDGQSSSWVGQKHGADVARGVLVVPKAAQCFIVAHLDVTTNFNRTIWFGLKLDYHHQKSPSVVGQWMQSYDSLELSPDEHVRGIELWLDLPVDVTKDFVHVAAIRIDTAKNRSKTFCSPDCQISLNRCLREERKADEFRELTGIKWGLTYYHDRVGVITSWQAYRDSYLFLPLQSFPHNRVQKLFFKRTLDDGSVDQLTTVVAHFRNRAISGVTFNYGSGETAKAGDTDTDDYQEAAFDDLSGREDIIVKAAVTESALLALEILSPSSDSRLGFAPGIPDKVEDFDIQPRWDVWQQR